MTCLFQVMVTVIVFVVCAVGTTSPPNNDNKPSVENSKVKEAYFEKLNDIIKVYITTLDGTKQEIEDEGVRTAIDIVKQLIQQTWIHLLKPGPNFIPLEEKGSLEAVEADLIRSLKETNKTTPVADAILTYSREIDDKASEEYGKERKSLKANYKDIYSQLGKAMVTNDYISTQLLEETLRKEKEEINAIDYVFNVQQIIINMYIHSYLLDFVPGPYEDKVLITSSKGADSKEFNVPPMGNDLFMKGFYDSWLYRRIKEEVIPEGQIEYLNI